MLAWNSSALFVFLYLSLSAHLGAAQPDPEEDAGDSEVAAAVVTITAVEISSPSSSASASDTSIDLSSLLASITSQYPSSQTSTTADYASLISSVSASLESVASASRASASSVAATMTSSSRSSSISATITSSIPTATSSSSSSPSSTETSAPSVSNFDNTASNRNLTIILAVVFALLGISLIFIAFVLIKRYRHGQTPFSHFSHHRGATPIDDEEIATWRRSTKEITRNSPHNRTSSAIIFPVQQGYSWTVHATPSPNSLPSGPEPPRSPPSPAPPMQARAPNSRSGLTDEAIPGADPFIASVKRQPSRLSKVPTHGRTKSRRSSISVSSMVDRPETRDWNETYDEDMVNNFVRGHSRNGSSVGRGGAGLAPRPQTSRSLRGDGRIIA